jgi:hypothetical protein
MGLFTNNKKPCPICGEGTPRLLATEIAGDVPICSDCAFKISIGTAKVKDFTLKDLKEHLTMREENANRIKNEFRPNKSYEIGWTKLNIDEANKLFTIPLNMCGDTNNPPVFKFEELMGYELEEENCVIERFNRGDRAPLCTPMMYTPVQQMTTAAQEHISRDFKLNLYLTNPYWDKVESSAGSASGSRTSFQWEYRKYLGEIRIVTMAIAAMIGVDLADENNDHGNANAVAGSLMKFKELLDAGIITQEEFDAKKKQLLGI